MPLRVTLLSPARSAGAGDDRPAGVLGDAPMPMSRKDMRGAYPRHPWPEDPTEAEPTLRAKPRGT